jgi:hypothetical protein
LLTQGSQQVQALQQVQQRVRSMIRWQSWRSSGSAMRQWQSLPPPQRRILCLQVHQVMLLLRWLARLLAWQKQTTLAYLLGG